MYSIGLYRRAIEIDPLYGHRGLGLALLYAGRHEEAKAAYGKALEFNPEMAVAHAMQCRVYLAQSRPQEALLEAERGIVPLFGRTPWHWPTMPWGVRRNRTQAWRS